MYSQEPYTNTNLPCHQCKGNIFRPIQQYYNPYHDCNYETEEHISTLDNQEMSPPRPVLEPPSWSFPAKGESRLEPIGETMNTHPSIDLTTRRCFHVGRSPSSDIPLLHFMSSRNHALLLHNSFGVCYITDCNSVHGTYVDGVRIMPHPHPPRKVRRGALLRFGGPGAPTFVLKKFAVRIDDLVRNLGEVADTFTPKEQGHNIICESTSFDDEERNTNIPLQPPISSMKVHKFTLKTQTMSHNDLEESKLTKTVNKMKESDFLTCIRGDGGGLACIADKRDAPTAALVLLNTRLNAIGQGGLHSSRKMKMTMDARHKFTSLRNISTSSSYLGKRKYLSSSLFEGTSCSSHPTKKYKSILVKPEELNMNPNVHFIEEFQNSDNVGYRIPRRRKIRFSDEEQFDLYSTAVAAVSFDNNETEFNKK